MTKELELIFKRMCFLPLENEENKLFFYKTVANTILFAKITDVAFNKIEMAQWFQGRDKPLCWTCLEAEINSIEDLKKLEVKVIRGAQAHYGLIQVANISRAEYLRIFFDDL